MLQLFFGNDTIAVRQAALAYVAEAEQNGRVERIDCATVSPGVIAEIIGSVSLFGESTTYVLDMPKDYDEWFAAIKSSVADLVSSSNTVVVIEGTLLAAEKKVYANAVAHEFAKVASDRGLDTFALANTLLTRDKKSLWLTLVTLRRQGVSAEELIGILWWQLKALRLAAVTASAAEADMKSFPYDKAKKALRIFTATDIERLSATLLAVYHDGHGGVKDIDIGLEEWVLGV